MSLPVSNRVAETDTNRTCHSDPEKPLKGVVMKIGKTSSIGYLIGHSYNYYGDLMSKRAIDAVFEGLFLLTDIRSCSGDCAPACS